MAATVDAGERTRINERLKFLWEQYMNMVNLFITLSTGSLALSTSLLRFDVDRTYQGKGWLQAGLIALVASLVFSLFWRVGTHIFMEQEVFGESDSVDAYYATEKVHPFTSSHLYTRSEVFHRITNTWVIISMFCTGVTLPTGLACIAMFVFQNLP